MAKGNQSSRQIKVAHLLTLIWGDYLGLSRWDPNVITRVLRSRRGRQEGEPKKGNDSKIRGTQYEDPPRGQRKGPGAKECGWLWKLRKARKQTLPPNFQKGAQH